MLALSCESAAEPATYTRRSAATSPWRNAASRLASSAAMTVAQPGGTAAGGGEPTDATVIPSDPAECAQATPANTATATARTRARTSREPGQRRVATGTGADSRSGPRGPASDNPQAKPPAS